MPLYPLRFEPIYKRTIWGGRRFEAVLGRHLPSGEDFAESWEVCDHGEDQSVVQSGPLAGASLHELVVQHGAELLGRHHPRSRFPLLLKYLDANRRLSVQVHPDDATAAKMRLSDPGKTESWVIMAAEEQSSIWAGFNQAVDRELLRAAITEGCLERYLHHFQPLAGQCIFLPARTVHALGDGILVAEIQQTSDLTFRLYDWNRVESDGKPRELHIQEALDTIDYRQRQVEPCAPQPAGRPHVQRLVACEKFVLDRWQFRSPETAGGDNRCHIVTVLDGSLALEGDPRREPLRRGDTALLPAGAGQVRLAPVDNTQVTILDAYLP